MHHSHVPFDIEPLLRSAPPAFFQPRCQIAIHKNAPDGAGQRFLIPRFHQQAADAVLDDLGDAAQACADGGTSRSQRW